MKDYLTAFHTYKEGHDDGYDQALAYAIGLLDGPDNREMVTRILKAVRDDRAKRYIEKTSIKEQN